MRKAIGPGYTKLRSHALQAIHLIVFAHDDVLPLVSGKFRTMSLARAMLTAR